MWNFPQAVSIAIASCLTIVVYWFYSAYSLSYQNNVGRDQIADNTYFLGFILTLTAMTLGLIQYDPSNSGSDSGRGNLDVIIQNFGIALTTTIVGMMIRSVLLQGFRDGEEIQRSAALDAAEQLKDATDAAIKNIYAVSRRVGRVNRAMARGVPLSLLRMRRVRSSLKELSSSSDRAAERIEVSSKRIADVLEREIAGRAAKALLIIREELEKLEIAAKRTSGALAQQTSTTVALGKASKVTRAELNKLADTLGRVTGAVIALAEALEALASALDAIDEEKIELLRRVLEILDSLMRQLSKESPEELLAWSKAVKKFLDNVEKLGTEFLVPLRDLIHTFPELGVRADCAVDRLDRLSDVLKKVNTPPQHVMEALEVLGNHSEKIKSDITQINTSTRGFIANLRHLRTQSNYAAKTTSSLSTEVAILGNQSRASAPKIKTVASELQDLSSVAHDDLAPELELLVAEFKESSDTAAGLKDAINKVDETSKQLLKGLDEFDAKLIELSKKKKGLLARWFGD